MNTKVSRADATTDATRPALEGGGGGGLGAVPGRNDRLDRLGDLKPKELFPIRESRLCAELGFSKDELRARRCFFLAQGRHWDYVKKRVQLSSIGAEILRSTKNYDIPREDPSDAATVKRKPLALLPEKNPPPIVFSGKLLVHALPRRNERLVVAYIPGADPENPLNLVSVHVRSNLNFLRGMELPGPGRTLNRVSDTAYELQGACPRWRGRW